MSTAKKLLLFASGVITGMALFVVADRFGRHMADEAVEDMNDGEEPLEHDGVEKIAGRELHIDFVDDPDAAIQKDLADAAKKASQEEAE